jgi:peptidoglycan/xylan/chitin deacetylase (PgdA/CDA1 family)
LADGSAGSVTASPARRLLRAAQRLVPGGRDGLRILCYHLVGGGTRSPVDVPAHLFVAQLGDVRSRFDVAPLRDAVARLERGEPSRAVALTFDDAYGNFYEQVWPLLWERRLPATLFVPVGFVLGESPAPMRGTSGLGPCTWSQLREMVAAGLDVGSHSWTHADLRRLDDQGLQRELHDSRLELEQRLGVPVPSFCYPRALWSPRVEAKVGASYDLAVVGGGLVSRPGRRSSLRLQRVSVRADAGASLGDALQGAVCLEEWLADRVRRWR